MCEMKTNIYSLFVYLALVSINGQIQSTATKDIETGINEFISIQKELPDANLYRKTGHWIMRASSDKSFILTRVQFTLQNDQVIVHEFVGQKRVYSGVQSHIKDNKAIQSVSSDGQQRIILHLQQDDKILVSLLVSKDKQVLSVLVKACETSHIDDNSLRTLISQNVLNKPNVRSLVEELVTRLVFVNRNLPPINYDLDHSEIMINIAESDLVDVDLSQAVGNWSVKAMSGNLSNHITHGVPHLNGDQLVVYFSSNLVEDFPVTVKYIDNSRVIRVDIYAHKLYSYNKHVFLYVDATQFISFGKSSSHDLGVVGVFCRVGNKCDEGYLKGVIDNLLLFTQDVRREIKELVPKLIWR